MSLFENFLALPLIKDVFSYWRPIFVITVPIIAIPLALNGQTNSNGDDITKVRAHSNKNGFMTAAYHQYLDLATQLTI